MSMETVAAVLPSAAQKEREIAALTGIEAMLASLAAHSGGIRITSWSDVRELVRRGLHRTVAVGDQLTASASGTEDALRFDVLDHDRCAGEGAASLVLGLHGTLSAVPFGGEQLLFYTAEGLGAGTYRFTLDHAAYNGGTGQDGTYCFTTTASIPAGGGFRHSAVGGFQSSYGKEQITGGSITLYGALPGRTAVQDSIPVTEWDGQTECTDLGVFSALAAYSGDRATHNITTRNIGGSNRYRDSAVRQWLNSDAAAVAQGESAVSHWWTARSVFDLPPSNAAEAGFLYGLGADFLASLGTACVRVALPECDRVSGGAQTETLRDRVFLFSRGEVFGASAGQEDEGTALALWSGAEAADRIRRRGSGVAVGWWLRSPYSSTAQRAVYVNTAGDEGHTTARQAEYLVAGAVITAQ